MSENNVLSRPVRIHIAMRDGPIYQSIMMILSNIFDGSSHTCVEDVNEADLIIFTEVRDIERGYDKEKFYVYLLLQGRVQAGLPENCMIVNMQHPLLGLAEVIKQTRERIKPLEDENEVVNPEVPLRPDALRILVIEDSQKHQASAKVGLAGHKLTVASGYEEAMKILGESMIDMQTGDNTKFDVVLTDLQLPMSSQMLSPDAFKIGELVPYGILLMIEAAHRCVKRVAVVTDLKHHANWLSAAFDHFHYHVQIDGAKVLMMHAPMSADGTKDWAAALDRLMKVQ